MNLVELYRLRLADGIEAGDISPMMVFPIGQWHSAKYPELPLTEQLADELIIARELASTPKPAAAPSPDALSGEGEKK